MTRWASTAACPSPTSGRAGYWTVASDGGIFSFGRWASTARWGAGRSTSRSWAWPRPPPRGATGWWPPTAASSPSATPASTGRRGTSGSTKPIVGMAATPDGGGYWLVASDGGDLRLRRRRLLRVDGRHHAEQAHRGHGRRPPTAAATGWWPPTAASSPSATPPSTARPGPSHLNQPVVGMAATPDGGGYWLVASDGGIFSFGDAGFHGSTGAIRLNQARGGHGRHPRRQRLLAGGLRRRHLRLRRHLRRLLRLDGQHPARPSRWWGSAPPRLAAP